VRLKPRRIVCQGERSDSAASECIRRRGGKSPGYVKCGPPSPDAPYLSNPNRWSGSGGSRGGGGEEDMVRMHAFTRVRTHRRARSRVLRTGNSMLVRVP
jgi:hypothetical protein